jgi:membrane fusion protein (multidrug efflux system)
MKKQIVIMGTALALLVAVIGTVKFLQVRAAIAQGMAWQPPPEAVTTVTASQESWPASLRAVGSVAAVRGVLVSADLPGIVADIEFESGKSVRAGEVLVRLDTKQEQALLEAAVAQRDLSRLDLARAKQLLDRGVLAQAEFDRAAAEAKTAEASVHQYQAAIERKTIRAPFAGVLGIRQINIGQYLDGGAAVVPLQAMDPVYVNFALPQQDVAGLPLGAEVTLSGDSVAAGAPSGRITAINSVVDETTRNVQVQATFRNPHGKLRPGQYVETDTRSGAPQKVIAIPTSAVSYAPYGNSVFVVSNLKDPKGKSYRGVQQRFVKLAGERGDQVAVVSGLQPGEEVVTSGVFKLRNGAAVLVNNKVRPGNNPAPKPEDS